MSQLINERGKVIYGNLKIVDRLTSGGFAEIFTAEMNGQQCVVKAPRHALGEDIFEDENEYI